MEIKQILQKSWRIVWQYRALWILGMVLNLTAANTIFLSGWRNNQDQPNNSRIIVSNDATIYLPGDGITIDLTAPAGHRVILTGADDLRDLLHMEDASVQKVLSDLSLIGLEILFLFVLIGLLLTVARYVAETAVIRMVDATDETGSQLTLRRGIRQGWSIRAARLFAIDLLVGVLIFVSVALILAVILAPIFFFETRGLGAIFLTSIGVLGVLGLTGILFVGMRILLSLVMQPVRRACVLDDKGIFASIGIGIAILKSQLKDVGAIWLIWIGIRILWAPVGMLVALVLLPLLPIFLLAGILIGLVPALAVAGTAGLFVNGYLPWIMGLIFGLPLFVLVTISPLLFVGGWVEIFKSSMWTLAYRKFGLDEQVIKTTQPVTPLSAAA